MEDTVILEVHNVCKQYRKKVVLDSLSVTLKSGHIYGFVGNNGAGKSTFFRIISGLSRKNSGSIALFGSKTERQFQASRRKLGVLIEAPAFYSDMTISQNLKMEAMLCDNRVSKEDIENLRNKLGISSRVFGNPRISQCSMGEKQRAGIVAALLGKPELLLLDEPFNGLDPSGVVEVRDFLKELNQSGVTMLISSHILEELHKLATDYIFIDKGRMLQICSAASLDADIEEKTDWGKNEYSLEQYFRDLVEKQ